ncbi:MAG: hypothetical protein GC206_10525 [Alphaproteobacteria bacterium]|nr:hypothetical protein [Alphaproteobacteria bacterium]
MLDTLLGMYSYVVWFFQRLGRVLLLFVPITNRARASSAFRFWLGWVLHVLIVIGVLVGLYYLNRWLDLDRIVRAPTPGLRRIWLPLLAFLLYLSGWLAYSLWRLTAVEPDAGKFPDIDTAWSEGLRALDQAAITLTDTPLFLILGRPGGSEKALFAAAQLPLKVTLAPRRFDAPLGISAHPEAIYVTCPDASLAGRQSALLAASLEAEDMAISDEDEADRSAAAGDIDPNRRSRNELEYGGRVSDESQVADSADNVVMLGSAALGGITDIELGDAIEDALGEQLENLIRLGDPEESGGSGGTATALAPSKVVAAAVASGDNELFIRPSVLANEDQVELLQARLRHLARKIAADRKPFCPINGILLLVPNAALDSDQDAKHYGEVLSRDLDVLLAEWNVLCPIFVVVCDLERESSFRELLAHVPVTRRRRFLGLRFPLVPELDLSERVALLEKGINWVGGVLFPSLVYKLWRTSPPPGETVASTVDHNARLYRLLWQMRARRARLSRILIRALALQAHGPLMLGGCYFAATGREPEHEQGFVAGVFRRLIENQNYVTWTPKALDEDTWHRRATAWGYGFIALVVACVLMAVGWLITGA